MYFRSPVDKSWVTKGHTDGTAMDLGWLKKYQNKNQDVFAMEDGVVLYNGYTRDLGHGIVVKHDYNKDYDMWVGMGHFLNSAIPKAGSTVIKGQKVANMGKSGISRGEHVHIRMSLVPKNTTFTWGNFGKYKRLDPLNYVYEYPEQEVEGLKKLPEQTKPVAPQPTTLKVGDTVQIKDNANKYTTGQTIPKIYKGKNDKVLEIANDKALLKNVYSWVYTKDLLKGGATPKPIVPKPKPSKPNVTKVKFGGRVRLFTNSKGNSTYPAGSKNKYTNVKTRTVDVLARENGRTLVRVSSFNPTDVWLNNGDIKEV